MTTRGDLDRINQGAVFQPQTSGSVGDEWDGTRPCLNVAGVQVYAYVETVDILEGPVLVVSLDFDTAGQSQHAAGSPNALGCEDDGEVLGWDPMEGVPTEVRAGDLRLRLRGPVHLETGD